MRQNIMPRRIIYMLPVFVWMVIRASMAAAYDENDKVTGYSYLNQIRTSAGMTLLNQNLLLEEAAQGHADYLVIHGLSGHYQNQSQYPTGFTGVAPADRITTAGYSYYAVGENVSVLFSTNSTTTPQESIDDLMGAIYHRFTFLDFQMNEVGIGLTAGAYKNDSQYTHSALVYDLGVQTQQLAASTQNTNPAIIRWPSANSTGIPAGFYTESPYPLTNINYTDGTPTGYPISVQFNAALYATANVSNFKLYRVADGVEITNTHLLTQANDPNALFTGFQFTLFPLEHLEWGKAYRAEMDYTTNTDSGSLDWQFTTKCLGPMVTVNGNGDSFSIPTGSQNFAVYVNANQAYPNYQTAVAGLSLTVAQEDNNTYLFSTGNGDNGDYFVFYLNNQSGSNVGSFTANVSDSAALPTAICEESSATARLTNISTRANILGAASNAIAGFIIKGSGTQQVMVRGIAAVAGNGTDPVLTLKNRDGSAWNILAENDEWEDDSSAADIPASLQLPDRNSNDAGLLRDLSTGVYTVELGSNAATGLAVVGVDAVNESSAELVNISTRANISGGANDAFAGFIIKGSGTLQVMIRGIAAQAGSGIDPKLTLMKHNGSTWDTIAINDEWEDDFNAAVVSQLTSNLQLPDRNGNDAGMLRNLSAGVYSVQLGSNGATGLATVGVDVVTN